ncbi:hypothetical protein ACHAWF_002139 [Thalassiosira exigua]
MRPFSSASPVVAREENEAVLEGRQVVEEGWAFDGLPLGSSARRPPAASPGASPPLRLRVPGDRTRGKREKGNGGGDERRSEHRKLQ